MSNTVVVVGSGPCGATAAAELVARGVPVTLLDAGTEAPAGLLVRARGNTLLRFVRGPMESARHVVAGGDPGTQWHSSLSLGGLSNYWTAAIPRFHPRDFDEGERLDVRYRWPVSYEDVEPWYRRVEQQMGVTAGDPIEGVPANVVGHHRDLPVRWRSVARSALEHGFALGVLPMAAGRPTMAALRPTGWNSWHCLVKPLLGAPGFRLVRGARVFRISWSSSAGVADAVEYVDAKSGTRHTLSCRAVVLAAGALDSTRVLLQSRSSDFPDGLGNSSGVVGRYVHDHPKQWWPATFDRPLPLLAHPAYIARAAHASSDPLMGCSHTIGMVGSVTRVKAWAGQSSTVAGVQVFGTMVPDEAHTVSVARDDDPIAESRGRLELNIAYDDRARNNMVAARERFVSAFAAAGVKATPQGPFPALFPGDSVHYAGSVRMHADGAFGALNGWNRMHDVPNVAVVDLSCFTTNPEKNPTLTAMALAARAANRLADDLATSTAY